MCKVHTKPTTSMFCLKQAINNAGLGLQIFSPVGEAGILLASISTKQCAWFQIASYFKINYLRSETGVHVLIAVLVLAANVLFTAFRNEALKTL
jgi:hypothetical protein